VADFTFADIYKAASLSPGPDIIHLRQVSFESLRPEIDATRAVTLTRLYFGLPVPEGTNWFRDGFANSDPSFSMRENEREAAVLSACLLAAAIEDREPSAALAPLTVSVSGTRIPLVWPELLDFARAGLLTQAIKSSRAKDASAIAVSRPLASKTGQAVAAIAPNEWAKLVEVLKEISAEAANWSTKLSEQVNSALVLLTDHQAELRTEVDMLWWYVGASSRVLEIPFAKLRPALAAVMAGFDLADLTHDAIGPVAAPALLQRLLGSQRKTQTAGTTIKSAVDAFDQKKFGQLRLSNAVREAPDIFPVLAAFSKAAEIGKSPAWHEPFRRAASVDPETALSPLELAVQVYREKLLLSRLVD